MNKRGALALTCAVVVLGGCSGGGDPPAKSTSSTSSSATRSTADTAYLTRVRQIVTGGADEDLITQGKDACAAMTNSGATRLDAASRLVSSGFDTAASAAIVTSAVAAYCPGVPG